MAANNDHFPGMDDFRRYQNGEMSFEEQHKLEMLMLDDPFVAEAFEGFLASLQAHADDTRISSELRGRLAARVERNARRSVPIWPYASAASALVCLGLYWMIFLNHKTNELTEEAVIQPAPNELPRVQKADHQPAYAAKEPLTQTPKPSPAKPATGPEQQPLNMADEAEPEPLADAESLSISAVTTELQAVSPVLSAPGAIPHADSGSQPASAPLAKTAGRDNLAKLSQRENSDRISEVVVLPGAAKKAHVVSSVARAAFVPAEPAVGWKAYQAYLEKNSLAEQQGKVTVSFTVGEDGTLSEISARGPRELHEQAIRLVRQGPVWKAGRYDGNAIALPVQVEIEFHTSQ